MSFDNSVLYSASKVEVSCLSSINGTSTCSGTGFFVYIDGQHVFFITNRHMVDWAMSSQNSAETFVFQEAVIYNKYFDQATGWPSRIGRYILPSSCSFIFPDNPLNDIACCVMHTSYKAPDNGSDGIAFGINFDWLASEDFIRDQLRICDRIAYTGYPGDTQDRINSNPIIRSGTIASDPRVNYSPSNQPKGDLIAYEGFSFGGSSGSPVFALQRGFEVEGIIQATDDFYRESKCIGINAGHGTTQVHGSREHAGISWFYKSSAIIDVINKAISILP